VTVSVVNGIAQYHHDQTSIDVAGNYEIEAAVTEFSPGTGLFVINSNAFTVTPFTATDHLVFVKAPSEAAVDVPFSATVAVEDQFGNIDTSVSNVRVDLFAAPGNLSTGTLKAGEATFNDAFFVAAGTNDLVAFVPETDGILPGSATVVVGTGLGGTT
jgi:hypothetical protein